MKKLLLILLCFPMIGFGQDNCGNKPIYHANKFGNYKILKEYKNYKKEVNKWNKCKGDDLEINVFNQFK